MDSAAEPNDPRTHRQRQTKLLLAVSLALFGIWLSATFLPALIWAAIRCLAKSLETRNGTAATRIASTTTTLTAMTAIRFMTLETPVLGRHRPPVSSR